MPGDELTNDNQIGSDPATVTDDQPSDPYPQPQLRQAIRAAFLATIEAWHATLPMPFIQAQEKLIDKYFPE